MDIVQYIALFENNNNLFLKYKNRFRNLYVDPFVFLPVILKSSFEILRNSVTVGLLKCKINADVTYVDN